MSDNTSIDFFTELDWTKPTEDLLVSWADIALCYTWIFDKSYRKYNNINFRFTIPIIVLSTITGTLGMSMNSLFSESQINTGQIAIGGVNIFIGILSTLQNFFRYAQQSELHLAATKDWAKLHRNIKIELSIERRNRKPAAEFVRYARQEYERLLNSRPVIPSAILEDFKRQYRYSDVIKPEVLEKIRHIIIDDESNMVSNVPPKKPEEGSYILNRLKSFRNLITRTPPASPSSPKPYSNHFESFNTNSNTNTRTPTPIILEKIPLSHNRPIILRLPTTSNASTINTIELENIPSNATVDVFDDEQIQKIDEKNDERKESKIESLCFHEEQV